MSRTAIRETEVSGVRVPRGQVVVPTALGDDVHGPLRCPAAPLVAGSLRARGRQAALADLADLKDGPDAVAHVYVATCAQQDGSTAAIAAAAAPGDALSATAARAAVEEWAAAIGSRTLLLAASPWCTGAMHAASAARQAATEHQGTGRAVYVLTPVALPPETGAALAGLGAVVTPSLEHVGRGDVVVFPAHGVTASLHAEAERRGASIVDATCPLVAGAQAAAARAAELDHQLVLVGQPGHAATEPIASRAPGHVSVAGTAGHTAALRAGDAARVSYLTQPGTTLEAAAPVVSALRSRYPAARAAVPAQVCYAPSDRAGTVYSVAQCSDVMLVVGDPGSADVRQVTGHARDAGAKVHAVGDVADIRAEMVGPAQTIGMAESTSAPAGLAAQVLTALSGLGRLAVARRKLATDTADH